MAKALISCGILIGCYLVSSCSSDRKLDLHDGSLSTEPISEETINDFVATCIKFRTTSECVCAIDELARSTSDSAIRKMLAATDIAELIVANQSQCFDGPQSNDAPQVLSEAGASDSSAGSAGISPSSGNVPAAPQSATWSPAAGPTERAASTAEICLQDKINGEMQRKGGDVSIAKFDQFRSECGL